MSDEFPPVPSLPSDAELDEMERATDGLLVDGLPSPVAADGLPSPVAGVVGESEPLPEWTEDVCPCLQGPCRHYWEISVHMDAGNAAGTWDALGIRAPRHVHRICTYSKEDTPLETLVYECSRQEPEDPGDVLIRQHRLTRYHEKKRDKRNESGTATDL